MRNVALIWLSFVTKVLGWLALSFGHACSTWWSCGLGCVWACGAYKDNSSSSPPYSRWIIYDSFWLIPRVSVYHPLLGVMRTSIWAHNKWSSNIWKCSSHLSSAYYAVFSLSLSFINLNIVCCGLSWKVNAFTLHCMKHGNVVPSSEITVMWCNSANYDMLWIINECGFHVSRFSRILRVSAMLNNCTGKQLLYR